MAGTQDASSGDDPAGGAEDWAAAFFRDADTLELPRLMNWFDEAIDLRIANMPPILGRDAAEQAFAQFWSTLSGMSHRRETLVVQGDSAMQGSIVTYTRREGKQAAMPVASHLRRVSGGRLDRLWIYIDLAPLYVED